MSAWVRLWWGLVMWLLASVSAYAGTLVATTHPLYLIAQAVTAGIETPVALLPPASSGHEVNLRPADRLLLKQSDFVVWFGAAYEAPLRTLLTGQSNAIALLDMPALHRLPLRDLHGQPIAGSLDPHLWLDPANAIGIAYAIATVRARQYPKLAERYLQNAAAFRTRLLAAVGEVRTGSNSPRDYWVYHDAFHYIEPMVGLRLRGAMTVDPELPPAAGQWLWLSQSRGVGTICIVSERPLDAAMVHKLQPVRVAYADEVMATATDFVQGWRQVAEQLRQCAG